MAVNTLNKIIRDNESHEKMIRKYEELNANAETITRMATPEETEMYLKMIEDDRQNAKYIKPHTDYNFNKKEWTPWTQR